MRWPGRAFACALVAGCGWTQPTTSPAVVWAGSDSLNVEGLAHLLVLAQPYPLEEGAVVDLARHWQHAMLLVRHRDDIGEFAVHADLNLLAETAIGRLRNQHLPDPHALARSQAASVYANGEVRLIAHVLRRADAGARTEERQVQRRAAEGVLRDLRAGASWATVNARNEDDAARAEGGLIGLVTRDELPSPLDSVVFALAPGQISEVVQSAAGFHVLYRPAFDAMPEEFTHRLAARIARQQEAELGLAAAARRNASLAPVAALRVRELAVDPWVALDAQDVIGTFDGGALHAGALARALAEMPWDARSALAAAPAQERAAFVGRLLVRAVLGVEAHEAGHAADPGDTAVADSLVLAARPAMSAAYAQAGGDVRLAVDRYMGSIAARHVQMRIPPAPLILAITDSAVTGFTHAGIAPAIERARTLLQAAGYTGEAR